MDFIVASARRLFTLAIIPCLLMDPLTAGPIGDLFRSAGSRSIAAEASGCQSHQMNEQALAALALTASPAVRMGFPDFKPNLSRSLKPFPIAARPHLLVLLSTLLVAFTFPPESLPPSWSAWMAHHIWGIGASLAQPIAVGATAGILRFRDYLKLERRQNDVELRFSYVAVRIILISAWLTVTGIMFSLMGGTFIWAYTMPAILPVWTIAEAVALVYDLGKPISPVARAESAWWNLTRHSDTRRFDTADEAAKFLRRHNYQWGNADHERVMKSPEAVASHDTTLATMQMAAQKFGAWTAMAIVPVMMAAAPKYRVLTSVNAVRKEWVPIPNSDYEDEEKEVEHRLASVDEIGHENIDPSRGPIEYYSVRWAVYPYLSSMTLFYQALANGRFDGKFNFRMSDEQIIKVIHDTLPEFFTEPPSPFSSKDDEGPTQPPSGTSAFTESQPTRPGRPTAVGTAAGYSNKGIGARSDIPRFSRNGLAGLNTISDMVHGLVLELMRFFPLSPRAHSNRLVLASA